jgi:hypothetical protein
MTEHKPNEDTDSEALVEPVPISSAVETAVNPIVESRLRLALRPRHRRYGLLAASVAIAATFGALVGSAATGAFSRPAALNVANVEEDTSIQQSVARLSKEMTSLKASLETANKSAQSQIAKISERLNRERPEITGSITPPPTMPASAAPLPMPRPTSADADTQPPAKVSIVTNWSIRGVRDGYVYVQGHGNIYEVVPGAPLPGLGPVEQIKRQDGRWVVVTPKGLIVSMRDRRYFEQF